MESIVFRWQNTADTSNSVEWVTVDAEGRPHISTKNGSLDDLARQLNSNIQKKHAIFLLPANYYSLHKASLPPKLNNNNVKKAAPYAIEDELIEAIDNYHFAYGNIEKNDNSTVAYLAAINKILLTDLISQLEKYNIKPKYIYPETLLLPLSLTPTIYIEKELLHTRIDNNFAHTLPLNLLTTVIDDFDNTDTIKIISQTELEPPLLLENIEYELIDNSLLHIFARQLQKEKPLNLLQGKFKHQEEISRHIKPWRWPFALTCTALLLALLGQILIVHQLSKQNLELEEEKVSIYKQAFPKSRNVNVYSVRNRMEQALKKISGGTGNSSAFIPLLQEYSKILNDKHITTINSIEFNKDKLSLNLTAKDIQALDQIKIKLENSQQVIASIISSKAVNDGVEGTLKLELR